MVEFHVTSRETSSEIESLIRLNTVFKGRLAMPVTPGFSAALNLTRAAFLFLISRGCRGPRCLSCGFGSSHVQHAVRRAKC